MSQSFIDQVRAIVMKSLSNEKFGVRDLASELGLSTSQVLRKVKKATGKSVSQYIRHLRLEKAAKLIKKSDHTMAEISYEVGFASPSYFNNAFVKYYGIAPGEYKAKSKSLEELAATEAETESTGGISIKKLIYGLVTILILVVSYFLITIVFSSEEKLPNSIAVLPFKDLSPEDNQWVSDGITDNILHVLAQMQDLKVISNTSSSTYRNSEKKISEIAEELGVSYIVEGSVTLYNDKIKVITQLIDSHDNHVWSKEYEENFKDIIQVQNNVAREVMRELRISLDSENEKILNTLPTNNIEAYSLYMKARNLSVLNISDVKKMNELYKKAISLDSGFSDAYSGVAYSYFTLSHRYGQRVDPVDARDKSKYYANKALQLDSNNYMAWLIKGGLEDYINWDKSFSYYKKAESINSNSPSVCTSLGTYFDFKPIQEKERALDYYQRAYKLNPLSRVGAANLFSSLLRNDKVEEAEAHFERSKFLTTDYFRTYRSMTLLGYKNKNWNVAVSYLNSLIDRSPDNTLYYRMMSALYDEKFDNDDWAIEFAKRAFELDSSFSGNNINYVGLLIEGKKFEKAKRILQSSNYLQVVDYKTRLNQRWYYHYHKKEFNECLEILNDSLFNNQYLQPILTYAQVGDKGKVDSLQARFPWGTGRIDPWDADKAMLYAVLRNKDSMYYHLNRLPNVIRASTLNSRSEFDPYRQEERFKAFQRKWYFPVQEN